MDSLNRNQSRRKHSHLKGLHFDRRKSIIFIDRQMTIGSSDTLRESYHWVVKRRTCLIEK